MVFYYSHSRKTEVIAQAVGEHYGMPVYKLETDLELLSTFRFILKALWLTVGRKPYPVTNMPDVVNKEIYLCSPVWGGHLAAPGLFFLQNANLRDVKVNIVMTASTPVEKYRTNGLQLLDSIVCVPGEVRVFATAKNTLPEVDIIKEHLDE